jgi:hypothetical protein
VVTNHHAFAEGGVTAMNVGLRFMAMSGTASNRRRGDNVMMTRMMVVDASRGGRRRTTAMMARLRRHGDGMVMAVMNPGLGGGGGQGEQSPDKRRGQGVPLDGDHAVFPVSATRHITTHARNCFNTMGTSPGKSSLINPGPNTSAAAA